MFWGGWGFGGGWVSGWGLGIEVRVVLGLGWSSIILSVFWEYAVFGRT